MAFLKERLPALVGRFGACKGVATQDEAYRCVLRGVYASVLYLCRGEGVHMRFAACWLCVCVCVCIYIPVCFISG